MDGRIDVVQGRIREAAGALTGNDELREEEKTNQVFGKTKQAVREVTGKVKRTIRRRFE